MPRVSGAIVIQRPVEEVFDFVADARNEPRYNLAMRSAELLTDGPIGIGARFRSELVTRGRAVPMTTEYTEYDRPHHLGSVSRTPSTVVRGALTFEPAEDGTRMSWSWDLETSGVLRFLGPLVGFMGRRLERRIWTGLKRLLEEEGGG